MTKVNMAGWTDEQKANWVDPMTANTPNKGKGTPVKPAPTAGEYADIILNKPGFNLKLQHCRRVQKLILH